MAGASSESRVIVVTGATGFIGRALVTHLRGLGRSVRAVARAGGEVATPLGDSVALADLAYASDEALDAIVRDAAAVVHLAGRAHVMSETADDPAALYAKANAIATSRLAGATLRAGVARFVLASTAKVNGETSAPSRPFRPTDPPDPRDDYARSKLAAEQELLTLSAGTAMAPIVLRLPLVYGPGVKANFERLLEEVASARLLPLGAIRNRRSLLYVGNLVEAIVAALDAPSPPSGVHFVADAESASTPELLTEAGIALGVPARLIGVPVPLLELGGRLLGMQAKIERIAGTLEIDTSSFTAATGWRPRHSLAAGLAATASWWRMRHAI